MKFGKQFFALTPLCALLASTPALATNGYFAHGYGMKAKGMGGVATAMSQDAFGGANNPASMVWAGTRLDLGMDWFSPVRDAERSGSGPGLNGKVDSGKENFFVPEIGYNHMLNDTLSLGVTVYGNGGMNTTYPQGNYNCGGGAANILCGSGELGVDLMQLIVAPTVAYKVTEQHSLGLSLLLGYQRFKAQGVQAFANTPNFSSDPANVTNNGYDSATGAGVRIGYLGRINDQISIGAAYSSQVNMSRFDKYRGLFAENGDFDIPANYSLGIAFNPAPDWTVAADYMRIEYSGVASVGNPSMPVAQLGAANGPGFGWKDINVYKIGAAWRMNDTLTLRAGYNKGDNPIRSSDVTFNILAPGVMTDHYSLGFTYAGCKDCEFTGALTVAPRKTVSGGSLFNGLFPTDAANQAGNETIGMRQIILGLAWGMKF